MLPASLAREIIFQKSSISSPPHSPIKCESISGTLVPLLNRWTLYSWLRQGGPRDLEPDDYQKLSDRWATANTTMTVVMRSFHKINGYPTSTTHLCSGGLLFVIGPMSPTASYIIHTFPETLLSMPELQNLEIIVCNFLPGPGGGSDSISHFNVSLILSTHLFDSIKPSN